MRGPLDLSSLDDKLLDGLRFYSKVYDLFDQIMAEPDGLTKVRLLSTKREKRLTEELLPIAHYVQSQYRANNRIKIRWLSGSQPYDAIVWTPLIMVRKARVPRKIFVEITTSVHKNSHLVRRLLHEKGGSFGPKGIQVDKKTGKITSKPYINFNDEGSNDLASQIIARIADKSQKQYPPNTVLIVNCHADGLLLEPEWNKAIQTVKRANLHESFMQVFIREPGSFNSATLFGFMKRPKLRRPIRVPSE